LPSCAARTRTLQLRIDTGVEIYFADPYSPWQASPRAPTCHDTAAPNSRPSPPPSTPPPSTPPPSTPPPKPSSACTRTKPSALTPRSAPAHCAPSPTSRRSPSTTSTGTTTTACTASWTTTPPRSTKRPTTLYHQAHHPVTPPTRRRHENRDGSAQAPDARTLQARPGCGKRPLSDDRPTRIGDMPVSFTGTPDTSQQQQRYQVSLLRSDRSL
jgi:hypothetical protein